MAEDDVHQCDYPDCEAEGVITSRLSPEGFLVATGEKAYSFREAYVVFNYCQTHHDELMNGVWKRSKDGGVDDGNPAPTSI